MEVVPSGREGRVGHLPASRKATQDDRNPKERPSTNLLSSGTHCGFAVGRLILPARPFPQCDVTSPPTAHGVGYLISGLSALFGYWVSGTNG